MERLKSADLLMKMEFQALLEVHDEIAAHIQNSLEEVKYIDGVSSNEDSDDGEVEKEGEEEEEKSNSSEEIVDTFRVIGLRRKPGESLVINVYRENLRFLIHFNSQEEFLTAVDMDEFLEVKNILDGSIL